MKGILNLKTIIPKQIAIWDPDIVLKYVKQLDDEISEKLVILLSILSGQRTKHQKHLALEDSKIF